MLRLAPPATSHRSKFENCVKWDLDRHAPFHWCIAEVGNESLKNTDMTHYQSWVDLLFNVNDNRPQAIDQITVAFSARKSAKGRIQ
jgi:hypothetical protein